MVDQLGGRHPLSPLTGGDFTLSPWRPARITSATAWSEASLLRMIDQLGLSRPADGRFSRTTEHGRVWWTAPRQVLVVAEEPDRPPLSVSTEFAVHVETAAHVGFRAEGAGCRQILARLMPLDFAERSFPVDGFATTRAEGVAVRLARRSVDDRDGFDLLVGRNLAGFFAEVLTDAAAGFGIAVPPSGDAGLAVRRLSSREVFGPLH